jgi:hypothetical protein
MAPRQLKPQKVEDFHDRPRRQMFDLMLDRNSLTFFALIQGERLEATSIIELRKLVASKCTTLSTVEWSKVIELELHEKPDGGSHWNRKVDGTEENELRFQFSRFEIGQLADGTKLKRRFTEDLPEFKRADQERDGCAHTTRLVNYEIEKQIPYSEERWAALLEVSAGLDRARERLARFFEPKTAALELDAFTQPQLPAGVEPCDRFDGELARPSVCSRCSRPLEAHDPEVITAAELARQTFEQRQLEQNKRKSRARSGGFTSR